MSKAAAAAANLLLALIAAGLPARSEARPVVIELFTSQGCSSCPPADAFLAELARRKDLLALGFHISYWNGPAWKDPLSSEAATERQKAYARRFNAGQVYTPEMVIDGAVDAIGSDRAAVLAAIGNARPQAIAPVMFADDQHSVAINNGPGKGEVLLARFVRERSTDVGGGENAGRVAHDANAVRELTRLGLWDGTARDFAIVPPGAGEGVAVLVQAANGAMLGDGYITAPSTQGANSSSPKPSSSLLVLRREAVASTRSKMR